MSKTLRTLAVAALTSGLALSGCSFSGGDAAKAPADGGARLRMAMLLTPRAALSPLSDDAFKLTRWGAVETLVMLDKDFAPSPGLATEWKQTDPHTWSFTIREGVTFQDGTAMTPQHVADSLNFAAKAKPIPRILDGIGLTAAVDGKNVTVSTATSDPLLPMRMSSPQLVILAPRAYAGKTVSPIEAGTGPFTITKVNGSTSTTLERFDGYWGDKAKASGIDITYVPDGTARAAALRTGTADIVEAVPAGQAQGIDPKLLHEVPTTRTNSLLLNNKTGVFKDPAARASVREALDIKAIVDKVYEGHGDAGVGLLGPALPWMAAQRESPAYKAILAKRAVAKVPGRPAITLATFSDRPELPEVAVQIQNALEAKGFTVKLVVKEYQYLEADAMAGTFDAFIMSRSTMLDSGDPVSFLASDFTCKGSYNIAQVCNPAIDQAITAAEAAPAGDQRRARIAEAEATILAGDAVVPLVHERVLLGEQTTVVDTIRDPGERRLVQPSTRIEQ